jgi:hypothetical protein
MGRRPKADAIRRARDAHEAEVVECVPVGGLAIPLEVANNPLMLECWEWTVEGATHFRQADVPRLILLSYWWAVARQCMANLSRETGIVTEVLSINGVKQAPDIKTLDLATSKMDKLSAELGVGPLARQRMGLNQAAMMALASSVPLRIFKMLDEHYE